MKTKSIFAGLSMLVVSVSVFGLAYLVNTSKNVNPNTSQASGTIIGDTAVTRNVFVLIFNPILQTQGQVKLTQYKLWGNPSTYTTSIKSAFPTVSGGYLNYNITETKEVNNKWYPKSNGYTFTESSYLACSADIYDSLDCDSTGIDYGQLFTEYDICSKNVDEVWIWGGPWFGYDEFRATNYCGGKTQFVMGFNYEAPLGNAYHDFNHRWEYIANDRIGTGNGNWQQNEENEFNKFSMIGGHCGNAHYPPGTVIGSEEYMYDKVEAVTTDCDGYNSYPGGPFTDKSITCTAWGCNQEGYAKWWMSHIPHKPGTSTSLDGKTLYNNWWKYYAFFDETQTPLPQPSVTPVAGCQQTGNTFCANPGDTVLQIPYDISTWQQCLDWCKQEMTVGSPLCQFNADSGRACWVKKGPATGMAACNWQAGMPPYGACYSGYVPGGATAAPTPTATPTAAPVTTGLPTKPVLKSPLSATLQTTPLSWNASTPVVASKYNLQFSTDLVFSSPLNYDNLTALTMQVPTDLQGGIPYYWRVRGKNSLGQYGDWSLTWNFKEPVKTPILIAPSNGSSEKTLRPTFTWGAVAGVAATGGYTIQFSKYSNFSIPLAVTGVYNGASFTPTVDIAAKGVPLYWRVRSATTSPVGFGPSAWSETRSLTMPNPPSVPVLKTMVPTLQTALRPIFNWNAATNLPTSYKLQVSTSATDFSSASLVFPEVSTSALTYPSSVNINPLKTYYWRVRSSNANNELSSWSAASSFNTALAAPNLITPVNGSQEKSLRPTFSWTSIPNAKTYTIELSLNNTFTPLLQTAYTTTAVGATTYIPTVDIASTARGKTVYYRVRAATATITGFTPGINSSTFNFRAPNPPNSVKAITAQPALLTTLTPQFKWTASMASVATTTVPAISLPNNYRLQIATDATFSGIVLNQLVSAVNTTPVTIQTFTPTAPLSPANNYYWRVRSENTSNEISSWFPVAAPIVFRTPITIPSGLSVTNPTTLKPTFKWTSVAKATKYTLKLFKTVCTGTALATYYPTPSSTISVSYTLPTDLPSTLRAQPACWEVQANSTLYGSSPFAISTTHF